MKRLYNLNIPVIGLTGGIATGKSHVSQILKSLGCTIIDADRLVKEIYSEKQTFQWLLKHYPDVIENEEIDFQLLRRVFFSSRKNKEKIEDYIYSHLERVFKSHIPKDTKFLVYDIPLLYEKNMQKLFDAIILVFCSRKEQLRRICKRDKISEKLALKILDNQLDIEWKRKQESYKIDNNLDTNKQYKNIDNEIKETLNKIKKGLSL